MFYGMFIIYIRVQTNSRNSRIAEYRIFGQTTEYSAEYSAEYLKSQKWPKDIKNR